ncbi:MULTISPECIES: helix-turn-helix domain-containing protein [Lysinibacillus]|uniref:Helix-turn-helix transcriptional regulator n=1 Tax=Lysinibacillus tabacifolii TaxID=1173107 RepID=A0ABY2T516_9BACI|nr:MULTISPECIES: helix-turn-helix transcriptional regulator [Lysinibacillus]TKI50620.1 helix-turn-helix transcriptional regulator [Lysinibacillus tabacifolii]
MNLTKLKVLRENKNISYRSMASKLDVSFQYYWMIENGKRGLSYEMAVKIAEILDTTPDYIFLDINLTNS